MLRVGAGGRGGNGAGHEQDGEGFEAFWWLRGRVGVLRLGWRGEWKEGRCGDGYGGGTE